MQIQETLLPDEELELQQLLQLQVWNRKKSRDVAEDERPGTASVERLKPAMPELWELTRGVKLRAWQEECVDRWFNSGCRGVIKVVTGAGKTMLALAVAERLQRTVAPELRVAVVVPTIVLLDQWRDELLTRSNLPPGAVGLVGGGEDAEFTAETRILICVLNSAAKKLPHLVERASISPSLLLVVDECHRAGAAEMQKIFLAERAFSLGLSATPERDDSPDDSDGAWDETYHARELPQFDETVLGKELGPVVYELNYADAIRLAILPPFVISHYGLELRPPESAQYERISRDIKDLREELERPGRKGLALLRWARSQSAAGNGAAARLITLTAQRKRLLFRMQERANAVLRILQLAFTENPETKAILFHESIEEVMRLFVLLRTHGFPVVAEHSDFPDGLRAAALRLFRNGTARIIVSARSLIEGFNVPSADVGIIVAASSSVRQRVQTLGRLLRKAKDSCGAEKNAALHVLYARNTVDEVIYEKADWEHFVGAERNQYFTWANVNETEPVPKDAPPRTPPKSEDALDETLLEVGSRYPGDIDEGIIFSRDSQGTIRTEDGKLIEPNPELLSILKHSRKAAGRFRVTPRNQYVIELNKTPDGWEGVYLGRLAERIRLVESSGDSAEREFQPGDLYPLSKAAGKVFAVLQRDPRLVAIKKGNSVRFVAMPEDGPKRNALEAIQSFLKSAYHRGHRISKIVVTEAGHVVYLWQNLAYFVGHAPEGAEGFIFES